MKKDEWRDLDSQLKTRLTNTTDGCFFTDASIHERGDDG